MRKIIFGIVIAVVIGGISGIVTVWILLHQSSEVPAGVTQTVAFTIDPKESLRSVAQRLEKEALIQSADLFLLYTRIRRTDGTIQAGTFSLQRGQSIADFHDSLLDAPEILVSVLIPEGSTIRQIAARLETAGLVDAEVFESFATNNTLLSSYGIAATSLQGFLFPDTYLFPVNVSMQRIIETMVEQFFYTLEELAIDTAKLSTHELYQTTVLASIVEREYRIEQDAPLIASVFYNRIQQRIPLQSCATIVYVITEEENKPHPTRLYFSDLKHTSLFNTYIHQGLPPSPIASPGRVALQASFFPAETEYLFFVVNASNTDTHIFSEHYDAHLAAAQLLHIKQES